VIAFFIEDFREWRLSQMSRTIALACLFILAVGAATLLQPILVVEAVAAISILLGWSRGRQYDISSSARRSLVASAVPPRAAAAGKVLSSVAIWLLHILILSPALALMAVSRGLRLDALSACACSWLAAYCLSLGLSFIASLGLAKSDGLFGFFLIGLWIGASALAGPIRKANPFVQAWDFLKGSASSEDWAWIGALAVLAAAIFEASILMIARIRKSVNA
jgi:hypothetical protein